MSLANTLPLLLGLAWLLPLASFTLIVFFGKRMGRHGIGAGYLASGAIISACALSLIALVTWMWNYPPVAVHHGAEEAARETAAVEATGSPAASVWHFANFAKAETDSSAANEPVTEHKIAEPVAYTGDWYSLAVVGPLKITIGWYIDALTVAMFAMVTLIASCIHVYAIGYMHDELHDVTDHEVTLADGHHLHRPGRFHRFFQYLSLFSFSMLGLVISGNLAMTFVFWELVGICSYFLIGFYFERKSASNAANKAFIVNRIGDFGFIIGLMALFGALGTFNFGDRSDADGKVISHGIFSQLRAPENDYRLLPPLGMVKSAAPDKVAAIVRDHSSNPEAAESEIASEAGDWRAGNSQSVDANGESHPDTTKYGYTLLIIAGLGVFCGCVGKSAQFPLQVWLPDAMEGPTPVSALVHSATMVAAGVYLVGRCFPLFTQEVLLVIAYIGCITLFIAATIAIVAVDIKRVLAYSTVSQLGLHDAGSGRWRLDCRVVPPVHARVFQKPALHVLRLGHSRHAHQRHAEDGRTTEENALHRLHDARRLPGDHRDRHSIRRRL